MAHSFVYWAAELVRLDLLAPGARLIGLTNPMTEAVVRNAALVSASKAALECYVRHLAVELGPLGHRVNLVKFGLVVTEAVRRTFPGEAVDRLDAVVRSMTPARRLCTIEEVAELVGFLAGPHGRWFNGAVIDFTGGESLAMFDQLVYGAR
jgi:NAD(P)-dependent dehydrogenase (short-subunit alcohol dehydrogenase family)